MKMRTALVRNQDGNLNIKWYDDYRSNKEFSDDLRANGFRVVKVWAHEMSYSAVMDWEFLNRK